MKNKALLFLLIIFIPIQAQNSFLNIFTLTDVKAARRGLMVFKKVCSSCHELHHLRYQDLEFLGYNKEQIKSIAAEDEITDIDDEGNNFDRPAKFYEKWKRPYINAKQAAYANNHMIPPDLSLITKNTRNGRKYIEQLLMGYQELPANSSINIPQGMYYNPYFSEGNLIAMPPPLFKNIITYQDKTPATIKQMASDVSHFLEWASDPNKEKRYRMGIKVIFFLLIFLILLIALYIRARKKKFVS